MVPALSLRFEPMHEREVMTDRTRGRATESLKVSIVINTDGRAASLCLALASLRYLRYPAFEVVVVTGPTPDSTLAALEQWRGEIKIAHCPERNLSRSRNIGIGLASGEIIAFLDDDAVPEPEWLNDIAAAFAHDRRIAAAGGVLHDHTGKGYQWRFGTVNRLADANTNWACAAPHHNFPMSYSFPHLMGANCAFRREVLLDVGGFDEEYDYYLDESDLICRIVDAGWYVAQLDNAVVHHKFMASSIRSHQRVLTSHFSVLKNKLYFMLVNARGHVSIDDIVTEMQRFVAKHRRDVAWCTQQKLLPSGAQERFETEKERAWAVGLKRGLEGRRRLADADQLAGKNFQFLRLKTILEPGTQQCFVLSSAEYPPGPVGGIGRYVHELARGIAKLGHQVHVLTKTENHDRVDFEDGVWVHRLVVREDSSSRPQALSNVPVHIWSYSRTILREAQEIAARRRVDRVVTPLWDLEGVAFESDPSLPHAVSLHTSLHSYLDSNPHLRNDARYMREFGLPMLDAERRILNNSKLLLANSHAIIREIEAGNSVPLPRGRYVVVPHGIDDWLEARAEQPPALPDGCLRLAFVGRWEPRKGIDVLMQVVPALLERHTNVWLDVIGNDKIVGPTGRTWRSIYSASWPEGNWRQRLSIHGEVEDDILRGFYQAADIIVAPSRFESFGMVHLEGIMLGKPVVGCRAGGMAELIDDGVTGLLAEPGDFASLERCLERLLTDAPLRERLAAAARQAYLDRFTSAKMANGIVDALSRTAGKAFSSAAPSGEPALSS